MNISPFRNTPDWQELQKSWNDISKANQATEDEEEDLLENTDPEMAMRKKLLESLFYSDKNNDDDSGTKILTSDTADRASDSVEISAQAIEMYRRQEIRVDFENESGERLEIRYERVDAARIEIATGQPAVQQAEPLVFDLDHNGVSLTDIRTGRGVAFDLTGDGATEKVSWIAQGDAFLALDRNANGMIDNGKELFGDQHGAADGFEELAKFDSNADGRISQDDTVFSDLRLWRDLNFNGTSEKDELMSLTSVGITSVGLTPDETREIIAGNLVAGYGTYAAAGGSGRIGEVFLNYLA